MSTVPEGTPPRCIHCGQPREKHFPSWRGPSCVKPIGQSLFGAAPAVRPEGPEAPRYPNGLREREKITRATPAEVSRALEGNPGPLSRDTGGALSEPTCGCVEAGNLCERHEAEAENEELIADARDAAYNWSENPGAPQDVELRERTIRLLDALADRLDTPAPHPPAEGRGTGEGMTERLTDHHADAIEFVVMALDKVAPRTGGANLRGRAKDAARIIRENCRRAPETPDDRCPIHATTESGAVTNWRCWLTRGHEGPCMIDTGGERAAPSQEHAR